MSMNIRNWKLALFAFIGFALLISLGCWQVSRARQKRILLHSFALRTKLPPLTAQALHESTDYRFFRLSLNGVFDNKHSFLLDNKIYHGKIGYEVYTPFLAYGLSNPILIDRGFVPLGINRKTLPIIKEIAGNVQLNGMLNSPPAYVSFGEMAESNHYSFPLRVEYINLSTLSKLLSVHFFPYVLVLEPGSKHTYEIEWQVVMISPERHIGYALQWFALAFTLLILFVILNRDPNKDQNKN